MLDELKKSGEAPDWMQDEGYRTLLGGYLLPDETPRQMYTRVAKAAASYYKKKDYTDDFFRIMWNNWLCPASPVLANMGTTRGLPISCNTISVPDSVDGIFGKIHEFAMLSKHGAGVGIYLGDVRARGSAIKGNGKSEGIVPWSRIFDTTVASVSQGGTRKGASAFYLPVTHGDIDEFLDIRRPTGDVNRRCLNSNHAVCIPDSWMQEMLDGDQDKRKLWEKILRTRFETGEPYLFFSDNVNEQAPECYKANDLKISTSNICNEIYLYTDDEHTFVCCLSSLNLVKWEEWKDTDTVALSVRFLDAVLEEYIIRSEGIPGFEPARRSAVKGRAIGLGVLGWHSLLQSKSLPFDSFDSMMLNAQIFNSIRTYCDAETKTLAEELGEPLWCEGFGRRNTHCMAVAPTVSNSAISGGYSQGIEPLAGNVFAKRSAKGTFFFKNPYLETVLEAHGENTLDVWKSISGNGGGVQHLDFLSPHDKEVFLTAREINQHAVIKHASQRQQFIDQGQSVNLFFAANSNPKYIHEVHIAAWESGMKGLYYLRADGVLKGDLASRSKEECAACEG